MIPIPLPATRPHGKAYGINDSNDVVGFMWNATAGSSLRAFLFREGEVTDLGTLGGAGPTEATAINASAVIVGYATSPSGNHAFRWENGVMTDLDLPLGPSSNANDVNDAGQIVGWMGPINQQKAFRWDNGVVTQLPFGVVASAAYSINNHGECVGFTGEQTPNGIVSRAVMWKADGSLVYLPGLPEYPHSRGYDINDDGTIIGWCFISPPPPPPMPQQVGVIWHDGVITRLADITPPSFGGMPQGINSNGQIAAQGELNGDAAGAVLTPIPGFPGDYNCDLTVNIDDLMGVINHWGVAGGASAADFDQNKAVDMDDLLAVINHWGPVSSLRGR